ncbi:efflux transporter outer membrane subunit [Solimonas marina]|uniref:Efflux transporter outer membrane subunit n=1 Tax=Solimonas marina TaxID=2714601 RepID=A0A969W5P0_9GAMM|nr:efflux transporter outer membrane subunit [Solimonas marina]NKF21047.1 efflux transporter outer membrane subunit [Solimonas marina]
MKTCTRRYSRLLPMASLALLSACAVGPDYRPPTPTVSGVPQSWHARLPHDGEISELAQWWKQFDDPLLTELVETAETHHPSIDQALGAVREARAAVMSSRGGLFPQLNANGTMTRSSGGSDTSGTESQPFTLFNGSLDASWEIDLFGGARRGLEASQARLQAAQDNWDEARVTLAAEVADAYVERRYCERLLALYQDTLKSREETERLTTLKLKAGFVAPADEAQAKGARYDSENQLIAQEGVCQQDLNRLAQLTAMPAGALEKRLAATPDAGAQAAAVPADKAYRSGIPVPLHPAVPSVPAAILSQRPDLMAAERDLAAASANIGVAVASRLPSLSLGGSIGINHLAHAGNDVRSWSFAPQISLPIFEGGAGRARVETARAQYDQALAQYRGDVLVAVQEVEDALTRVDASVRRAGAARESERNYSALLTSQENRYKLGETSLLELEDSRRLALSSRQQLAAVQLEISQSWIALYKAAGGGWNDPARAAAPRPNPVSQSQAPAAAAVATKPTAGAGA